MALNSGKKNESGNWQKRAAACFKDAGDESGSWEAENLWVALNGPRPPPKVKIVMFW